jgi:hypothetical protein
LAGPSAARLNSAPRSTAASAKVSATRATWQVTVSESCGKHPIKVTASDSAGNARSKSISVTNVVP